MDSDSGKSDSIMEHPCLLKFPIHRSFRSRKKCRFNASKISRSLAFSVVTWILVCNIVNFTTPFHETNILLCMHVFVVADIVTSSNRSLVFIWYRWFKFVPYRAILITWPQKESLKGMADKTAQRQIVGLG